MGEQWTDNGGSTFSFSKSEPIVLEDQTLSKTKLNFIVVD